ncbi:hypothetical protein [Streptomyces olivaceus]|uniref:hypothetical protein n=1 Tax=Streptomyces olivaceus TaxID=47716 RepID=UPI0022EDC32F|nr:hypothetical protein [Streptomyces olivaceus]GHI95709.1 hypothetical protein TPA0905_51800 [Streptomyces olivaceus]
MEISGETTPEQVATRNEFALERYRYILQQIHTINENAYRFLAIYQTLATTLTGVALTLFVGYREWDIEPAAARDGVIGLLTLATVVAAFTITQITVGALSWIDYRNEECDITDEFVAPGFRKKPRPGNLIRWYETYMLAFVIISIVSMWLLAATLILPAIK